MRKSRKNTIATIECEAEVDIDEYLEHASDECLIDEIVTRITNGGMDETVRENFMNAMFGVDGDAEDIVDALCASKNLSVVKAGELRELLDKFLKQ